MKLSLIVAVSQNGVIGKNNALPWRLSQDLKRFKALTMGHHLLMGRKTYESIGKPLPGRVNLVLSRRPPLESLAEGVSFFQDPEEALQFARGQGEEELFLIGGASLYEKLLSQVDRIYLTKVLAKIEGDAHFPKLDLTCWKTIHQESSPSDDRNEYPTEYLVLERSPRSSS